jgi:hypothetical protein
MLRECVKKLLRLEILREHVSTLLQASERCQALGEASCQVLHANQGAVARTMQLIEEVLGQYGPVLIATTYPPAIDFTVFSQDSLSG